jgi:hypothetical protein
VDRSTLRRGRPTANESFGNPASVLVGDFSRLQMMLTPRRADADLAEATNVIAEGEVLQLMNMHDATLDEEAYLRVIRSAAKLRPAPGWPPCWRGSDPNRGAGTSLRQPWARFQVIDDVLDFAGDANGMAGRRRPPARRQEPRPRSRDARGTPQQARLIRCHQVAACPDATDPRSARICASASGRRRGHRSAVPGGHSWVSANPYPRLLQLTAQLLSDARGPRKCAFGRFLFTFYHSFRAVAYFVKR